MVGSSVGLSAKVLAKQPASEAEIDPSGHQATKSSCTGSDPFWRVNVVVVLPVPDSPTIRPVLTPALVGGGGAGCSSVGRRGARGGRAACGCACALARCLPPPRACGFFMSFHA